MGTNNGLARFDRKQGRWTSFLRDEKKPSSISDNRILSLMEDASGTLWIGTAGGLNRYDRKRNTFARFTSASGLPSETIDSILDDSRGYLWLGTNRGISRFDPRTRSCRNFDVSDGLQAAEFRPGACLKTRDGHMYFGGVSGFNGFKPEDLDRDNPPSPVVLTSVRRYDTPLYPSGNPDTGEITLSYKDRFISFEFAVLDYACPQKNLYSYTLEGVDSHWILSVRGGMRAIRISLRAVCIPGEGSERRRCMERIRPGAQGAYRSPFWLTWWFRITALISRRGLCTVSIISGCA